MREEKIRELITRMMTDGDFARQMRETPGKVLPQFGLSRDEMDAFFNQIGGTGLDVLETRVSASLTMPTMGASGSGCRCSCPAAGLPPATCTKMGCGGGSSPPPPPPPPP